MPIAPDIPTEPAENREQLAKSEGAPTGPELAEADVEKLADQARAESVAVRADLEESIGQQEASLEQKGASPEEHLEFRQESEAIGHEADQAQVGLEGVVGKRNESASEDSGGALENDAKPLVEALNDLENEAMSDPEGETEAKERYFAKIREFFEGAGWEMEEDLQAGLTKAAGRQTIVIRRESPQRVVESIQDHKALEISFGQPGQPDQKREPFANAAILEGGDYSGLKIPYADGFSKIGAGSTIFVAGFEAKSSRLNVSMIPSDKYQEKYQGRDRHLVRMVNGTVPPESVKFVIVRFAARVFPEGQMTAQEQERIEDDPQRTHFITRIFINRAAA